MKEPFDFIQDQISKRWVVLAPKRAKRPGVDKDLPKNFCPFCPGNEGVEEEVFRIEGRGPKSWSVRVVNNKFPFAPIHEIVIHSPSHHQNFEELSEKQVEKIFFTYQLRFQAHLKKGQVVIFNNHGRAGGESLTHPHTQIAVVPFKVKLEIPPRTTISNLIKETSFFKIYKPETSQWPWEVIVAPNKREKTFASAHTSEVSELAQIVRGLLVVLFKKLGHEFPYNFYLYPLKDWYFRLMPRNKFIGGFELSTGIFVNSLEPEEAAEYLKRGLDDFFSHLT